MNNRRRHASSLRALAAVLAFIPLLCAPVAKAAAEAAATARKQEVVYGSLDTSGQPRSLCIVNYLRADDTGVFIDYGPYANITNLTDIQSMILGDDEVHYETSAPMEFIYQGDLKTADLPWLFAIQYELNGIAMSAGEISGGQGHLLIRVGAVRNPAANPTFFENCMLQVSLKLNRNLFSNVKARGATVANAGGSIQLTAAGMPDSPLYVTIEADVRDFEMDGLTIAALPSSFKVTLPDASEFTGRLGELTAAVDTLAANAAKLSDGVKGIGEAASALGDGYGEIQSGLAALAEQGGALVAASESIGGALAQLSEAAGSFTGNAALLGNVPGIKDLLDALNKLDEQYAAFNDGLAAFTGGLSSAASGSALIGGGIGEMASGTGEISSGMSMLANGMAQLSGATATIPDKINSYMDRMVSSMDKSEYRPVSFADERNGEIDAIQFTLRTDPIRYTQYEPEEVPEEKPQTAWDRIVSLFTGE